MNQESSETAKTEWAKEKASDFFRDALTAVAAGDERMAGLNAARTVTFTNAVSRVEKGASPSLADDPLYGRFWNLTEYFADPRASTEDDDLGHIVSWSI